MEVAFDGSIHCFLGKNGSGKTNLLEAIHYLSFTRGASGGQDEANIRQGGDHFQIRGVVETEGRKNEITCSYGTDRKKRISENGKDYSRFSEHIGKYPIVLVAPGDIELVWDGSEVRRKFFDALLAQLDKQYMEQLMVYQAHLRHRNSLLRMFGERKTMDRDLLETYDERMTVAAAYLHQKRSTFVKTIIPRVLKHYAFLVNGATEIPGLNYESDLDKVDFKKELTLRLDRDIALGRTSVGIHRDEFHFTLDGFEMKRYGSQGQQKSFLIALKLAEFDSLSEKNGFKPMLLLDDIFDKLDDDRIVQLMKLVSNGAFGQIFITDARAGRSLEILSHASVRGEVFHVEEGKIRR